MSLVAYWGLQTQILRDEEGDRNELKESCGNCKELKNVWPHRKSFKSILLKEH